MNPSENQNLQPRGQQQPVVPTVGTGSDWQRQAVLAARASAGQAGSGQQPVAPGLQPPLPSAAAGRPFQDVVPPASAPSVQPSQGLSPQSSPSPVNPFQAQPPTQPQPFYPQAQQGWPQEVPRSQPFPQQQSMSEQQSMPGSQSASVPQGVAPRRSKRLLSEAELWFWPL